MELGLREKTALVLGAGGGLGGAIARSLAREGAKVAVADINDEAARNVERQIGDSGGTAVALPWDLADLAAIEPNIAKIEAHVGGIDILVNNTGGPPPTAALGQAQELWNKNFQMMVASVIAITDRVVPGMKSRKWGRVITSASSGVVAPIANLAISNALRLALVGWSKTLSQEVAKDGLTVNVIVPGRIATDRTRLLDKARAEREKRQVHDVEASSVGSIPMGRYGRPEEYADVVTFLASERASYVNGAIIRVDGGLISSI